MCVCAWHKWAGSSGCWVFICFIASLSQSFFFFFFVESIGLHLVNMSLPRSIAFGCFVFFFTDFFFFNNFVCACLSATRTNSCETSARKEREKRNERKKRILQWIAFDAEMLVGRSSLMDKWQLLVRVPSYMSEEIKKGSSLFFFFSLYIVLAPFFFSPWAEKRRSSLV